MTFSKMLQLGALAVVLAASGALSASAHNDNRSVLRDMRGNVVHSTMWGTCVRINWYNNDGGCGLFTRDELTFYFDFGSSALTTESKTKLKNVAQKLKAHDGVAAVKVVGYADRIGNENFNEHLSRKRAEMVRGFLAKRGVLTADAVETRFFGETAPSTKCPEKMKRKELIKCLQPDRRVELEIDYGAKH